MKRQKQEPAERVVFRRWKPKYGGDPIAFFPDQRENGYVNSYQHVGQHGAADYYGLLSTRTVPADVSEPDVAALKRELESEPYEYRLRVVKRVRTYGNDL